MFSEKFNLDCTYSQIEKYRQMFRAAKNYKGTKAVFPNGSLDPWFSLGLTSGMENQANKIYATTIENGAHCFDMYPPSDKDSASVKTARKFIASKLDSFINP